MSETVTFTYLGEQYELEPWLDKLKCPFDGCRGTAISVQGMKTHLRAKHDLTHEIEDRECETCGEEFTQRPDNRTQSFCSVECYDASRQ